MPVLGDPDNTPNHYPPINGWEDLLSTMYPQDDIDLDAVDNLKYDAIINIYIKEKPDISTKALTNIYSSGCFTNNLHV